MGGKFMRNDSKVIALVVAYLPDEQFCGRLQMTAEQVSHVIVVDNTPNDERTVQKLVEADPALAGRVSVISLCKNVGVATALNMGLDEGARLSADFMLTLDQDTNLPGGAVGFLKETLDLNSSAAAACSIFHDNANGRKSLIPLKRGGFVRPKRLEPNSGVYEAFTAITSGSLFRLSVLKQIGRFVDDYFIDSVDIEYCLRIWKMGWRVLVDTRVDIGHSLGRRSKVVRAGLAFAPTNYPPVRHYYMIRNRLMLAGQYWRIFPGYVFYDLALAVIVLARVLLAETDRRSKLAMMRLGICDALRGKGGAYEG